MDDAEGPHRLSCELGASLWPSCVKGSELDTLGERYRISDTIEMFM